MLKLKKINISQQVQSSIQTQDSTQLIQQSIVQQQLNKLLKSPYSHTKILSHLSSNTFSSISSTQFIQILSSAINPINIKQQSDINNCLTILQQLISIKHDSKQVKTLLKKQKSIDSLFLLSILWQVRSNQSIWKYIAYIIECYPAEMILTAKQYVQKWEAYFIHCQQTQKLNQSINTQIKQFQLFEKLKKSIKNNHDKGFVDTYINL